MGIAGLGFGLSAHLPAWRLQPEARVLGICGGTNSPQAEEKAASHGVPYLSWPRMLSHPDIDIISLAVPPSQQPALIEDAARAGKHLFCEKPLGATLATCRQAARAVHDSGVRHAVDFFFSEIPAWQEARAQIAEWGSQVRHAHLGWRLESRAFRAAQGGWKTDQADGGGTLANFGSHSLHYLEWLFGDVSALCGQPSRAGGGFDLLLEFKSGMTATASVAADAYNGSGHRLEVYAEGCSLVLANNSGDFARGFTLDVARRDQEVRRAVQAGQPSSGDGRIVPVAQLMGRLVSSIRTGEPVLPGLSEGMRVQTLLARAHQALQERRWVAVEE